MKGGFSFCGIDIYDLGLEYVPDKKDTYVFKSASSTIDEESFNGHDGGYFYGHTLKPKDFTLRCYYENEDIRNGIMSKINKYFAVGKTGKLIFNKRQWCWYTATVTKLDIDSIFNFKNGLITIEMKAYYPFAKSDNNVIKDIDLNWVDVINNSGLLFNKEDIPVTEINPQENNEVILLNGGTAKANVTIELSGDVGEGVIIKNKTTDQEMKIIGFSGSDNETLTIDSYSGKCFVKKEDGSTRPGFLYHDYGFIDLAPAFPVYRSVEFEKTSDSSLKVSNYPSEEFYVGKYIRLNDWYKIVSQDKNEIFIDGTVDENKNGLATIALMNEIEISSVGSGDVSCDKIKFVYNPTFY